jgi:peptide/nickel transport system permease protein
MRRKLSVAALFVLILLCLAALFGPYLCSRSPTKQDLLNKRAPISAEHWLGTDFLGRDTFTRLVYGARISLAISFGGVLSGTLAGMLLGVFAGYFGKWADALISRLVDVLLAFPGLLLAITIVAILGHGSMNTAVAVAVFCIPSIARVTRSMALTLKDSEYVQAAKVVGASDLRIILTHIIPNSLSLIIVTVTLNLGTAILTASSLSFLGLGVQPPDPEWGSMLSQAREVVRSYPLGVLAPGLIITLTVMSFSLFGDGLRDALDPKLKNM